MYKTKVVVAVSGVKNSGKTTLITRLLPVLTGYGLKVATIKHDGHEFEGDVPGTDTYKHMQAGAYGTAVFSDHRFMVVKQETGVTEERLWEMFPEADLILLEGFKGSRYPKIETARQCVSTELVCEREGLLGIAADFAIPNRGEIPCFSLDEAGKIAGLVYNYWYCRQHMSMVVLAGGRSSRMGTDKADLRLEDKTFLQHQISKGEALGIEDIVVSGYRGELCGKQVVFDRYPNKGPLGGLEAALRRVKHRACLVLSVDVPLISVEELRRLIGCSREAGGEAQVTVLRHGRQIEPLIGVYRRDMADEMERNLKDGRVRRFLDKAGYKVYESAGEEEMFLNVNDREDYERAGGV
ncbi:MAG: molybdopterin-guanine dinucleotide biosynthesis protein B [Hungatella sp.]|nr:molybdopterin-guanine dinucleotide biosynthesis protein B [Hungatella sp.]